MYPVHVWWNIVIMKGQGTGQYGGYDKFLSYYQKLCSSPYCLLYQGHH